MRIEWKSVKDRDKESASIYDTVNSIYWVRVIYLKKKKNFATCKHSKRMWSVWPILHWRRLLPFIVLIGVNLLSTSIDMRHSSSWNMSLCLWWWTIYQIWYMDWMNHIYYENIVITEFYLNFNLKNIKIKFFQRPGDDVKYVFTIFISQIIVLSIEYRIFFFFR